MDLEYLRRLRALADLSDEAMANELRTHLFDHRSPTPSLETLVHAFLPHVFVDHTHADAILTLTNQVNAAGHLREALGEGVVLLDYVAPGFQLARAAAEAFEAQPDSRAMVWMRHGIVTWGATAREAYEAMIELATRAEEYAAGKASRVLRVDAPTPPEVAAARLVRVAPDRPRPADGEGRGGGHAAAGDRAGAHRRATRSTSWTRRRAARWR